MVVPSPASSPDLSPNPEKSSEVDVPESPPPPSRDSVTMPATPPSATRRLSLALQSVVEDLVGANSTADAAPDEDEEALKLLESITANNNVGEGSIIIGMYSYSSVLHCIL